MQEHEGRAVLRVVHSVNERGRVIDVTVEPSIDAITRSAGLRQFAHVLDRANALLHALDTAQAHAAAAEDLRSAIIDVRPYLAALSSAERPGVPTRIPPAEIHYSGGFHHGRQAG